MKKSKAKDKEINSTPELIEALEKLGLKLEKTDKGIYVSKKGTPKKIKSKN